MEKITGNTSFKFEIINGDKDDIILGNYINYRPKNKVNYIIGYSNKLKGNIILKEDRKDKVIKTLKGNTLGNYKVSKTRISKQIKESFIPYKKLFRGVNKALYVSDLHTNMNLPTDNLDEEIKKFAKYQAEYINKAHYDYYIINGDISWVQKDIDLFLNTLKDNLIDCKIRILFGNHDLDLYYTVDEYINYTSDIYLPTNPIITENALILGNSGFFDLTWNNPKKIKQEEYQKKLIDEVNNRYFKKETPLTIGQTKQILPKMLNNSQKQVNDLFKKYPKQEKIFITHYMPNKKFLDPAQDDFTLFKNSYMGSNLISDFLEKNRFDKCYYGHTHRRLHTTVLNGVKYYCNPYGTKAEWKRWGKKDVDLYETLYREWHRSILEIDI